MTGRQERDIESAHGSRLAESKNVLVALSRQPRLHQTRGAFRDNDLVMRRDVVAVCVRNKANGFASHGSSHRFCSGK